MTKQNEDKKPERRYLEGESYAQTKIQRITS
jgi:hypothetical protein